MASAAMVMENPLEVAEQVFIGKIYRRVHDAVGCAVFFINGDHNKEDLVTMRDFLVSEKVKTSKVIVAEW